MSTVVIKGRYYVPYMTIAIEFCDIDFMDSESKKLEKEWNLIRFKKYDKVQKLIESETERLNVFVNDLEKLVKPSRGFFDYLKYIFVTDSEMKEYKNKREDLSLSIYKKRKYIEELENDRFYSARELKRKAQIFLESKGYLLDSVSNDSENLIEKEIWKN